MCCAKIAAVCLLHAVAKNTKKGIEKAYTFLRT